MKTKKKIEWSPSDEGYVDSHDNQFEIIPYYEGTTRAQSYGLYEFHWLSEKRKFRGSHDTQRDAKAHAQDIVDGKHETRKW